MFLKFIHTESDQFPIIDWICLLAHTFVYDCFIDMLICASAPNDESHTY